MNNKQVLVNEIVDTYYEDNFGFLPSEDSAIQTGLVVGHLLDNNFSDIETMEILNSICKETVTFEMLPENLWENSLLEKDTFYHSGELRIISPPPVFNPITLETVSVPFYREMKIVYTINDILNKYYRDMNIPYELQDRTRDIGALNFLLKHYKNKIVFISNVDFLLILFLTVLEKDEYDSITNPLDLRRFEKDALEKAMSIVTRAKENKEDRIIWRKGR